MKATLQSVGDDTVAFNDVCYWVADNVKRFLNNFQAGMEVDVTVKDIDGTPMVTFLKKAGYPVQPQAPRPQGFTPYPSANAQGGYQNPGSAPKPPQVSTANQDGFYMLAATIAVAYNLDINQIKETMKALKQPITPPPTPVPVPAVQPGAGL